MTRQSGRIDNLTSAFDYAEEVKVSSVFKFFGSIAEGFYVNWEIIFDTVGAVHKKLNALQLIHPGEFRGDNRDINIAAFPGAASGHGPEKKNGQRLRLPAEIIGDEMLLRGNQGEDYINSVVAGKNIV